jgi:hypothetical protein
LIPTKLEKTFLKKPRTHGNRKKGPVLAAWAVVLQVWGFPGTKHPG